MRVLVHPGVSAFAAAFAAVLIHATVSLLGWRHAPLSGFIAVAVVMTWAILFPAKLVLAWRHRTEKSDALRRTADAASRTNELYAIQSRAHPHFLFNALNTVVVRIHRAEIVRVSAVEVLLSRDGSHVVRLIASQRARSRCGSSM